MNSYIPSYSLPGYIYSLCAYLSVSDICPEVRNTCRLSLSTSSHLPRMSIIEVILELVTVLLVTLIGVLGTWLTLKIGKKEELAAINAAQQEVILNAQLTWKS